MVFESNVGGRDRLTRAVLAVVFAVAALRALRSGRRTRGALAVVVAAAFAVNTVTCFCGLNKYLGIDTTAE